MIPTSKRSARERRLRVAIAIVAVSAAALAAAADYGRVTMTPVAPGIYLFTTTPYGDAGFGGNAVAIVSEAADGGVVLFDTSGTPASGEAILAKIRTITDEPVRYVINSHWHWDHWGGNQVFKQAFPLAQFLSHEKNRDMMMNVAVAWNAPGLERDLPQFIDSQKRQLAAAEAARAPEGDLSKKRDLLAADEDFLAQKRSVTYTFPDETFADSTTLWVGGREIRVLHARAITPGDTYVYLPKERILVTGDILVHPIPFAVGGSYPREWLETLQALGRLDIDTIIPGHGDAERDRSYLQRNVTLFQHVIADVKAGKAGGVPLDQLEKTFGERVSTYAADLGLTETQLPAFRSYFLDVFVRRAYRELERPLGDQPLS